MFVFMSVYMQYFVSCNFDFCLTPEIDINLFILEDASKLLIPHIVYQFVGFVIYHSSALRNSFIDLAARSARDLLLHVVYLRCRRIVHLSRIIILQVFARTCS